MIRLHSRDLNATTSFMKSIPDFHQDALPIPAPLVIPITQLLNTSGRKEPFSSLVALPFVRISMSATVQLHGHPCAGTVKIQQIWPKRMLPPKLEPGKTASPKRSPQLLFLLGLLAAQPPGLLRRIHARKISNGKPNSSLLSSNPSGGEGKGEEALLKRDAQRKIHPKQNISPVTFRLFSDASDIGPQNSARS